MARRSRRSSPRRGSGSLAARALPDRSQRSPPRRAGAARGEALLFPELEGQYRHRAERRAPGVRQGGGLPLGRGRAAHGPGADPRRHLADSPPDRGALRRARDGSGARPRPQGRDGLDNARLYAHEHDVSETLQRSLLPSVFRSFPACASPPATNPAAPAWGWAATGTTCSPCPTARWAWRWGTSPAAACGRRA